MTDEEVRISEAIYVVTHRHINASRFWAEAGAIGGTAASLAPPVTVLWLRLGEGQAFSAIAESLGVSRQRVIQQYRKALRYMRHPRRAKVYVVE